MTNIMQHLTYYLIFSYVVLAISSQYHVKSMPTKKILVNEFRILMDRIIFQMHTRMNKRAAPDFITLFKNLLLDREVFIENNVMG